MNNENDMHSFDRNKAGKLFKSPKQYLDSAGNRYLNFINGVSEESLSARITDMQYIADYIPKPHTVISVGVGQGEEIEALYKLFQPAKPKIIGFDLSSTAISAANQRCTQKNIPADIILGSVTDLPIRDNRVSCVVLSSVLHEVYSYMPSGKQAWNEAIQESSRVLEDGGCILLRESAAPRFRGKVGISLKTPLVQQFYEYFRNEYKAFSVWEPSAREEIVDKRIQPTVDLPEQENGIVNNITIGQAAELLFHFMNFWKGYENGVGFVGNKYWKEINETYFVSDGIHLEYPLDPEEYVQEVINQGNSALVNTQYKLICRKQGQSIRPNMDSTLWEHFFLFDASNSSSSDMNRNLELISQASRKMELVFQKIKI